MRIRLVFLSVILLSHCHLIAQRKVEKWTVFELNLNGPKNGNPFTDVKLEAEFFIEKDTVSVQGFYDGEGIYKIRYMPQKEGTWNYITISNTISLDQKKGEFICIPAKVGNHGPVCVKDTFHFEYADGKPYYPLGTTAYGWIQQNDKVCQQTLESLKNSPFNKVRIALLPHAPSGHEYDLYPFEGDGFNKWDFYRLNPEYFKKYEQYILEMSKAGIEADIFVFHPYDKGIWGFDKMNKEEQYLYLNYVNARFGAFRNVWWSMANEYDLLHSRTEQDWDDYFRFFYEKDPYHHLRSIHNASKWYNHHQRWVTHVSAQSEGWWTSTTLRDEYKKPVIFDEFCYEGDGTNRTVALSGDAIRHRFWLMTVLGAFATHGEGFHQPVTAYQFFRQGGSFVGTSAKELKILKKVLDAVPGQLKPIGTDWRLKWILAGIPGKYYVYYLGEYQNKSWVFNDLPENQAYNIDLIDTKNGNISRLEGTYKKGDEVKLPAKPYMAMSLRRVE